jgi:anti-anti-sigma factor
MVEDIVTVRVASSLDCRNATAFKDRCLNVVDRCVEGLILDFTDTRILSSPGVGSVCALYRHLSGRGGTLVLAGLSDQLMQVIHLTRMYRVIPCFSSVQAAKEFIYDRKGRLV